MEKLVRNRTLVVAVSLVGLLAVLFFAQAQLERSAEAQGKAAGRGLHAVSFVR